jgi:hypothetical protein
MPALSAPARAVFALAAILLCCALAACAPSSPAPADAHDAQKELAGIARAEVPIYDELNRPMNEAAEREEQNIRDGKTSESDYVDIVVDNLEQANALNETIAQEEAGRKSEYLTRAVLLDLPVSELAERIQAGQDVNAVDPVFGRALDQAFRQRRSVAVIRFLLDHGARRSR